MESPPTSPLGANLRRHRATAELTQLQVAEACDVTERTVRRWERSEAAPRFDELLKLARLYDTTVPDFFAGAS